MEIYKGMTACKGGTPSRIQLEAINALAKAEMKEEDVYVFSLRLCDDQVDRDGERFDTGALPALAKMFVGKAGVVDHNWSSQAQVARIFQTEVVEEDGVHYVKAWAYIRRCERTEDVIGDIEAGIKKEVSVGCAMGTCVCSICGQDIHVCGHQKGEIYDGQVCCGILREPMDAYEFSFVAVPAQPEAGVLKALGGSRTTLKELAEQFGAQREYRQLMKQAREGELYRRELEDRLVRLVLTLNVGIEEPVARSVAQKASTEELSALSKALAPRAQQRFIPQRQLPDSISRREDDMESDYLI